MKKSLVETISLSLQLGFDIVIPLLLLAILGRLLDKKFGTSPFLLLLGIIIAFITSSLLIFIKIKKIFKDLDSEK